MPRTLFRTTRFELDHLVKNIERGDIALPELQRPFVWPNRKVRDLLDSMLRGFPVGYLLFWVTGAEPGARAIGVDVKDQAVPRWLIVDGQQRLTSVYSVFTAHKVVRGLQRVSYPDRLPSARCSLRGDRRSHRERP